MATFTHLPSGSWRVQIHRKGRYVRETFLRREDARRWASAAEQQADQGKAPTKVRVQKVNTSGALSDLHVADMCEVGKAPARTAHGERLRRRSRVPGHLVVAGHPPRGPVDGAQRSIDLRGPIDAWEDSARAALAKTRVEVPPNTDASYSNIGYAALGLALEKATKTPYTDLVERKIVKPLGMTSTGFRPTPRCWPT